MLSEKQFGFTSANSQSQSSSNRMKRAPVGEHTRLSADPLSAGKIGFQKDYAGKHRGKTKARYNWNTGQSEPL